MLIALVSLLALSAPSHAQISTSLPYQCAAKERGVSQLYWGKESSREDWARGSALEACRQAAKHPAKCVVSHCNDNSQPDPDPTPSPTPPNDGRCESSIHCSGFEICVGNRCIDKGSSDNRCSSSIDCGFPEQCLNGRCLGSNDDQCSSNNDCSGFQMCVGRKCVDRGSSDNRCSGSFDCGFPSSCVDGTCQ